MAPRIAHHHFVAWTVTPLRQLIVVTRSLRNVRYVTWGYLGVIFR